MIFKLDVNNPDDPKIVAVGNNPLKTQIYRIAVPLFIHHKSDKTGKPSEAS